MIARLNLPLVHSMTWLDWWGGKQNAMCSGIGWALGSAPNSKNGAPTQAMLADIARLYP